MVVGMITMFSSLTASAQSKEQKQQELKQLLDSKKFVFTAESATPMGGGNIRLTSSYYQVRFLVDSLNSFLPYFGTAFRSEFGRTESPLNFTSSDFTYDAKIDKNGGRIITIKINSPQDPDLITLSVTPGGYGTLSVNSVNRQPISFYGFITEPKERKAKR